FKAAVLFEELELFLRLDALGDHANVQRLAHRDHGRNDCSVASSALDVVNERLIDFQSIDREPLQVIERGMSHAEIIDRDAHSEILEIEKNLGGQVRILHGGALGDLDFQETRIEARTLNGVADHGDDVRLLELTRGDVDRDSH